MDTVEQATGAQQLRAIKLTGHITQDHRIELTLPADIHEGAVEVIILVSTAPASLPQDQAQWLEKRKEERRRLGPIHPTLSETVIEERAKYEH